MFHTTSEPSSALSSAELPFLLAGKPKYFLYNAKSMQEQGSNKQQPWALNKGQCRSKVRDLHDLPCISIKGRHSGAIPKPSGRTSGCKPSSPGALPCSKHHGDRERIWVPVLGDFLISTYLVQGLTQRSLLLRPMSLDLRGVPGGQGSWV